MILLHTRDLALVWWAGLVSWTGNLAMFVALPVAVYDRTGSTVATAATVLGWMIPPALVGQWAGVVADRVDKRRLLVVVNLALAAGTLGYLAATGADWWALALLALGLSGLGQFLGPAEHALVPELVPPERLGEAAALNALNNSLARLAGPMIGGIMLAQWGFSAVVLFDAISYAAAALLLAGVRARPAGPAAAAGRPARGLAAHVIAWRAGLRAAWAHPGLRLLLLVTAVVMTGEGFVAALLAPFVRDLAGGGPGALGLILSAQAVGGIAGSVWASRRAGRADPLRLLGAAAVLAGVLLLAGFGYPHVYPRVWPAVLVTAVAGAPFAVYAAAYGLALQIHSPAAMRGRIFALAGGVAALAQIAGITVAGLLAARAGAAVIVVDGFAYLAAGAGVLAARRTLERPVAADPPEPTGSMRLHATP